MNQESAPAVARPPDAGAIERRGTAAQRIRAALVAGLLWLAAHAPEGLAIRLAEAAGNAWYRLAPARAARARRNLARVCEYLAAKGMGGERIRAAASDPHALEGIVRDAFRHSARYYLEVARTPRMTSAQLRERLLVETPEVIDRLIADGTPVVFVGLHFGAIELPGLYFVDRTGLAATVPMETIADPELQRYFVRTRGRVGLHIVGLREARRELLAALRRGEPVGIVGDRDLTGGGLEVPFFGAPAPLPIGPALLAQEADAPLFVVAVRRAGPGRYRGSLHPVDSPREGSRRERLTATMTALAQAFERVIAEAPEQWWAVFFPIWPDLEAAASTATPAPADSSAAATPSQPVETPAEPRGEGAP